MLKLTGKAGDFLKVGVKAAAKGDLKLVKEILSQKPEWLLHVGSHGRTMLWEACHKGKIEIVKFLISEGADINACGTHHTPYFVELSCYCIAKYKKHQVVAEYLLQSGAEKNIHTVAFLGELEKLKTLIIENPVLLNQGFPQHIMAGKNSNGLDFIPKMMDWATPLCYALRGGDVQTASFLIHAGAQISGFEEELFIAADDNLEMLRLLLSHGADKSFAPRVTPNDVDLYALLSEFGVEPMSVEELSDELVYLCRGDRGGDPSEVEKLLESGADINHQDKHGKTAIHRAAKAGFLNTMEVLIDAGIRLDIIDDNGETVLFETIRSTIKDEEKRVKAFQLLLKHGADTSHKNKKAQTVKDVAISLNISWAQNIL